VKVRGKNTDAFLLTGQRETKFLLGLLLALERRFDRIVLGEEHVVCRFERAAEFPILRPLNDQLLGTCAIVDDELRFSDKDHFTHGERTQTSE